MENNLITEIMLMMETGMSTNDLELILMLIIQQIDGGMLGYKIFS